MLCWFKSKLVYFLLAIFFGVSFLFSEDASLPANITRTFTADARPISFSIFKGAKSVVIHSNALISA